MEPSDNPDRQRRGSCLTIALTGGFTAFALFVLVLATEGWAVYAIGIAATIALFGLVHYFLWGRLLLRQTAGEREEEEVRRRAEERERQEAGPGANGFRRLP